MDETWNSFVFEFQFETNLIDSMPCDIKFNNYQHSVYHSFALCSIENEAMEQIKKRSTNELS